MSVGRAQFWRLAVVIAVAGVVSCGGKDKVNPLTKEEQAAEARDRGAIDSARMAADSMTGAAPSELAGSTWRLVQLRSSDDTVRVPERIGVYTVEFGTDGRASVVGGCNRGSGTYTVTPPSGLTFGPLATTRAMCPPGSLSQRYLGDFGQMRSFALVGGRLYISAEDGGIYEFAPEAPSPAVVAEAPVPFACSDSLGARSRITATFSEGNPGKVSLVRNRETVVLPQVQSGSGARYEGAGVTFWNKGRGAMVEWTGLTLNCVATNE